MRIEDQLLIAHPHLDARPSQRIVHVADQLDSLQAAQHGEQPSPHLGLERRGPHHVADDREHLGLKRILGALRQTADDPFELGRI